MPPRFVFPAIFVAACSATTSAPGQQLNVFDIYSGQVNFTTRSGMPGPSNGDLCALLPKDYYRCLGQQADSTTGRLVHRLNGIRAVVQDQDAGTLESLTFALVRDDPARTSFPDPDPLTEPIRSAPILTPGGPPGAPLAWTLQIVFATPFDSLPTDTDLHLAVGLPGNPMWPADGMSVHMSGWGGLPADAPFTGGTQPVP
ncbi:MAG: hypothetical protein HZB39_01250, partial [Planctomycetes bacterium]|nr:hypothetical protein [Planctomycetota bacterium]